MPAPYILARTIRGARTFAEETLGLDRGKYRLVTSVASVKASRNTDLYVLPDWKRRPDRFALAGALRYSRMTVIWVEDPAAPERLDEDPQEESHADDTQAWVDGSDGKDNRRRRRCSDCGTLVHPDEVHQHAAEHAGGE